MLASKKGRKKLNGQYSLDDPYSVLNNSPGTPRYWQWKKYELSARLENLGAFQIFFTLSCADMRWNENFTAFLEDHKLTYEVINGLEECFVTPKGGQPVSLEQFLKEEKNKSKFEYIRKNVLSATLHFNHRVQEFIKNIVMANKDTKMPVQYYNYRVEFQMRGAGHIHGTLWLDIEKLSNVINIDNPEDREAMDDEQVDKKDSRNDSNRLQEIFDQIKEEKLGIYHETCEKNCKKCNDIATLAWFVDRFTTCTLKDPSTRHLALNVQQHKHFPQSCRKRGTNCRFGAPWFPCLKTIIQVPPRIKFQIEGEPDEELNQNFDEKIQEATEIQKSVKEVLEDADFMKEALICRHDEIEQYIYHRDLEQKITLLLERRQPIHSEHKENNKDPEVLKDYRENVDSNVSKHCDMLEHKLIECKIYHTSQKDKIPMNEIKHE